MGWITRLEIADAWQKAKRSEIEPHVLAAEIAKALRNIEIPVRYAGSFARDFEALAKDKFCTFDDTDVVMERLYTWGDTERVWIATM